MPEYLAPGVFVEETSFRAKSIEGVGTSTAAFVGMTARGPTCGGVGDSMPPLLTSYSDFERYYGGLDDLRLTTGPKTNYMAQAANAFFANGGGRLYVARILGATAKAATAELGSGSKKITLSGRTAGGAQIPGTKDVNFRVVFALQRLATTKGLAGKQTPGTLVLSGDTLEVVGAAGVSMPPSDSTACAILTISADVYDPTGMVYEASGLGISKEHPRYIGTLLGANPPQARDKLTNPIMADFGTLSAEDVLKTLFGDDAVKTPKPEDPPFVKMVELTGGSDGKAPKPIATSTDKTPGYVDALNALRGLEDISIVAAPGLSDFDDIREDVNQALISHAEARRAYRIAVLDPPQNQELQGIRELKGKIDSKYAALYYPWLRVSNPLASTDPLQPSEIDLPPSGHVCGIYARNDVQRGVWKAPANETVTGAIGLQRMVNFGEQEVLNPLGINCIRALPNRGIRVWGARTISSDPEWKYVNIRRYFLYLESSIDRGTQWAVFEPNGEALWANIRDTISDYLYNEWVNGALLGANPKEAYFVRCDRSTMTQNDLDNGRLVCLIGVAAIKPAEFVIFRIGQKTADARG
jgi:hypothetical protein